MPGQLHLRAAGEGVLMYPRQGTRFRQAEQAMVIALRERLRARTAELRASWEAAKSSLRGIILDHYDAAHGQGPWEYADARAHGTFGLIRKGVVYRLQAFRWHSMTLVQEALREIGRERLLRRAHALLQTLPPGAEVRVGGRGMREADSVAGALRVLTGAEGRAAWEDRWDAWINAYADSLLHNIMTGALSGSSPSDAAAEVDQTRPGSPALDLWNILERILRTQAELAQKQADDDFFEENSGSLEERTWQTDERTKTGVCELCAPLNGLPESECGGEEPGEVHPFCNCYWRMLPAAWLDFMDGLDPAQAQALRDRGIAPDAMAVYQDGKVVARAWVDFERWAPSQAQEAAWRG